MAEDNTMIVVFSMCMLLILFLSTVGGVVWWFNDDEYYPSPSPSTNPNTVRPSSSSTTSRSAGTGSQTASQSAGSQTASQSAGTGSSFDYQITPPGDVCNISACNSIMNEYKSKNWAFNNINDFVDCANCPPQTHLTF